MVTEHFPTQLNLLTITKDLNTKYNLSTWKVVPKGTLDIKKKNPQNVSTDETQLLILLLIAFPVSI